MHEIAVLIPFANGTPWRRRALQHVMAWYSDHLENARILIGNSPEPWCKAQAVAAALAKTNGEPIVVIADADCLVPGLPEAVRAVRNGVAWAMPHLKVYRFGTQATERIYLGDEPGSLTGRRIWYDQEPYKGYEGGGVTVLRRDVYLDCPLDPGFIGWGQEDEAWALALNGLYGPPARGTAPLYHLWHEKPARKTRYVGSDTSVDRLRLYREAQIHSNWTGVLAEARDLARMSVSACKVAT